ncbi:MAG: ABC transporter permease [Vicinamibacterales bacterium]
MRAIRAALQWLLSRSRFEREMRDELRAHLEHRADDLVARGSSRPDALRQARVEFGALEAYKEQCRDESGFAPLRPVHGLGGDLRLAIRRLWATPLFTAFAVLSLAIGLGVTTAAYSVAASIFFMSSGIQDESRVALVMTPWEGRLMNGGFSQPDFEDLRSAQKSFTSLTASATFFPAIASPATTDLTRTEAVDGAYFMTLGVQPRIGRGVEQRDVATATPVAVLSHALWRLRFASDPAVIGQTVGIAGRPFDIVGVAPQAFGGLAHKLKGTHVWIPLSADPRRATATLPERDRSPLVVLGRLAPHATTSSASAELSSIGANLDAAYPRSAQRKANGPARRGWVARQISGQRDEDVILRRFGYAFVALVALVLVVACTNLANLVLARGTSRHQEFAVRRAIGASRWRLIREQSAESLVLAILGAGAAWMVFRVLSVIMDVELPITGKMLISFAPQLDPAVLGIAAAALLLSLVVFGLEPAMRLTRDAEFHGELAAKGGSVGAPKSKRQRALVRWQVAISTGFFIMASMSVKYAVSEARHDSGIDMDRIALATMNFWTQQWDETRAQLALTRVLEEVEKDPVVESAAVSTGVPFGATTTRRLWISTTDKPFTANGTFRFGPGIAATPHIFHTLGIDIIRGRGFDARDVAGATGVVVISARTARDLFHTVDAVGQQMLIKTMNEVAPAPRTVARSLALPATTSITNQPAGVRTVTVVGITSDTDVQRLFSKDGNVVYVPMAQENGGVPFGIAIARTNGDPYAAVRALRNAIRRVDPDLAIESSGTGAGTLGGPTVFLRAASQLTVGLGALTLLLAMVGLYGVQSQGVAHRTREIGVRMSFGATAADIRSMVLRDGYGPVVQGIAIGICVGFLSRGLMRAFLWEQIEIVDAWMLCVVPVPLVLAAFCACYWPAHRASRVDPQVALRSL